MDEPFGEPAQSKFEDISAVAAALLFLHFQPLTGQ